ncbi:GNAT family N-acetyltransferase [Alloscardovia omnicolens]|uniref:GNAT family N-acetyltransferase n=1 Tax=Alloscardovia omnicolens TaxID=419015 RepID=UPI003A716BE9
MSVILRKPTESDCSAIEDMVHEFELEQSAHDGGFWQEGHFDYNTWLEESRRAETKPLHEGFVRAIQYVLFDENSQAVGFANLRLELNDYLHEQGGHIGYSVRPSQRGRGYAKELLHQALEYAFAHGIQPVLVTCHENNAPSRAVILSQGGILEDVRDGVERYWIGK